MMALSGISKFPESGSARENAKQPEANGENMFGIVFAVN